MKKKYITPSVVLHRLQLQGMIAMSPQDPEPTDPTKVYQEEGLYTEEHTFEIKEGDADEIKQR